MKKLLLTGLLLSFQYFVFAQSWNPYVSQGIISPAPLLSLQLNGTGVVSFNIGNTGSSPLTCDPNNTNNNISLVISLSRGLPDKNPLDAKTAITTVGGTWADKFTWVYDMTMNTFTGTQNQTIPAQSQGSITIQYKVSQNSPTNQPLNGFNVQCTSPPYTHSTNSTNDDSVSCYTWAGGRDSVDTKE